MSIPAMVLPVALAAAGVFAFVWGWRFYFSLPGAERGDSGPLANDAGMWLGVALVLAALVLAALAVGAIRPRRLDTGLGVTLLAVCGIVLGLAVLAAAYLPFSVWSVGACLLLAYDPALIVVRLVWQSWAQRSDGRAGRARGARPTGAST